MIKPEDNFQSKRYLCQECLHEIRRHWDLLDLQLWPFWASLDIFFSLNFKVPWNSGLLSLTLIRMFFERISFDRIQLSLKMQKVEFSIYQNFWLYVYNTSKLYIEYSFACYYKASFLFSMLGFQCIAKGGTVMSNSTLCIFSDSCPWGIISQSCLTGLLLFGQAQLLQYTFLHSLQSQ